MKKQPRTNFDKLCKLDAVSNDENWQLKYIFFEDGYVYAANRVIAIRANLKDISSLSDDSIRNLNGKIISADDYKDLLGYDSVEVSDYMDCKTFSNSIYEKVVHSKMIYFVDDVRTSNYDEICRFRSIMLDTFKNTLANEKKQANNGIFCLNPYRLKKLIDAIGYLGGFAFYNIHCDMDENVLVVPCKSFDEAYDVVAIVKPMLLCEQVTDSIKSID